jgi:twitching motility protein PilT
MNLENLLKSIVEKGASDLHLCTNLPPIMRINNRLEKMEEGTLNPDDIIGIINSVIPDKEVDIYSLKDMDLGLEIKSLARFRVNIYRDNNGLCLSFRHIPNEVKTLSELGLPRTVERVCNLRRGLVIITGVAGCGKSTTLASIINKINNERSTHIITIEDPIEFIHKHNKSIVNQREVGTHATSFLSALRSALREDPDIILVGELRDTETISMAITAAETGHLVLATLHTRGAAQTVDRIIDVFQPIQQEQVRYQLSDVLEMIIAQVLIPSIDGKTRYLASELMNVTPAIRHLIRDKLTHQLRNEIEMGRQDGMYTLEMSLKELIDTGKISLEMATPWVLDKKFFERYYSQEKKQD